MGMTRTKGEGRCWMTPALRDSIAARNRLGRSIGANREQWLEACQEVRRLTREAKEASWRSFVDSLGSEANSSRAWGVIRSLRGVKKSSSPRNVALQHKGKTYSGDGQKANVFNAHYAAVSRHVFTKEERGRDLENRERRGRPAKISYRPRIHFSLKHLSEEMLLF